MNGMLGEQRETLQQNVAHEAKCYLLSDSCSNLNVSDTLTFSGDRDCDVVELEVKGMRKKIWP